MGAFGFQQNNYSCGTIAFINAVKVYGIEISYEDAKLLVGTTSRYGTDSSGIIRGIHEIGLRATEYSSKNECAAWRWLLKWSKTCSAILLVDNRQHWLSVTGRVKNKVIMVDPTAEWKKGENGVSVSGKEETLWRWQDRRCYAIRVSKN